MQITLNAETLTEEAQNRVATKLGSVFKLYGRELPDLFSPLKWKPLVLIIGNYSSGKSTFINEILEAQVQRTGQAPTDDSFTIMAYPEENEFESESPGATVVNDERLPFGGLRNFGESLLAHVRFKRVKAPFLQNVAIIDTPGMLDSVTEKDRGYEYLAVVGELARLSDLIILMFDPYKAGTIKETYQAIRTTLPGTTGEDRVLYVLNRIDECKNVSDLMRAYGTLCWNLSQMTGRKDIPRIFLTYSHQESKLPPDSQMWMNDRAELIDAIKAAPKLKLNHILHSVDSAIRELSLEIEALAAFRKRFLDKLKGVLRTFIFVVVFAFMFGDLLMKLAFDYPEMPLLWALMSGSVSIQHMLWPLFWAACVLVLTFMYIQRLLVPGTARHALKNPDSLIQLDTSYKKDLWKRIKPRVLKKISDQTGRTLWIFHNRNLLKTERFLEKDLKPLYEAIQQ